LWVRRFIEMAAKRKVEIFIAGCPACDETVTLVKSLACPFCDVEILDMKRPNIAARAKGYGIRSVPAIVVDGELGDCCQGRGPDAQTLRAAGVGVPIP
jgi:glutaredoxin 3